MFRQVKYTAGFRYSFSDCSICVSFVIPQIFWCVQGYHSFSNGQTYKKQDPNCKNSKLHIWYLLLLSFFPLKQISSSAPVKVFQPPWQHCSLYVMILTGVTLLHIQLFLTMPALQHSLSIPWHFIFHLPYSVVM